jgi:hypothetical protein
MQVSARVTVTPENLRLLETLDHFVALGFSSIGFSPMLRAPSGQGEMAGVDLDVFLEEMIACGREYERRMLADESYPFSNMTTALHDPVPALEFYQQRQLRAAAKARRDAAHFYALRANSVATAFWTTRSLPARERPVETPSRRPRPNGLPHRLRPSSKLRITEVPVLTGALIKRAPALSHPALEQPVAYFRGVELGPLIVEASTASTTEHLIDRWSLHVAPSTAREIATWMYAVGILTYRSELEDYRFYATR